MFFKLVLQTVLFQGSGYVMQFIAFFLLARILGAEDQGILTLFRTSGQIITTVLWLGVTGGIYYYMGKDEEHLPSLLFNSAAWFLSTFALFSAGLLLFTSIPIPAIGPLKPYLPLFFAFIFFLGFFQLFESISLSLKRYLAYNLFAFGSGLLLLTASIILFLLKDPTQKLFYSMAAYGISYALICAYGLLTIRRQKQKLSATKNVRFFRQFSTGLKGFISNLTGLLLFKLDLFLVGYFLTVKDVGIYSIALFSAEMVTKIPYWSAGILTPIVASNEEGNVRKTLYMFYASLLVATVLGLLIAGLIALFPHGISSLAGRDFRGVEILILLLLPRVIMQSGVGILAANLAGKGFPLWHPAGTFIGLICLVPLDVLLIPRMGVVGAPLANSLAFTSTLIVFVIGFKRYNRTTGISFKAFARDLKNRAIFIRESRV
jgi:O-antigen/teichoic acid export membrane protein